MVERQDFVYTSVYKGITKLSIQLYPVNLAFISPDKSSDKFIQDILKLSLLLIFEV